jgi:hypothetical protein
MLGSLGSQQVETFDQPSEQRPLACQGQNAVGPEEVFIDEHRRSAPSARVALLSDTRDNAWVETEVVGRACGARTFSQLGLVIPSKRGGETTHNIQSPAGRGLREEAGRGDVESFDSMFSFWPEYCGPSSLAVIRFWRGRDQWRVTGKSRPTGAMRS